MRRDTARLRSQPFDIAIVGGGMHGAWIALRAAEAGYSVALVERHDFGAATSANSLNILHGGLRYLQHIDFPRMRSSIRARREFARRFAHLIRPLRCVIPLKATGVRSPWILGPALLANDVLSCDRNSGVDEEACLPMGSLISAAACARRLAPLASVTVAAGAQWWDLLALDSARLTIDTIEEAARAGAVVANRVEALEYVRHGNAVGGIVVRDGATGQAFDIAASVVVNAAGPWAGHLSNASGLPVEFLPAGWVGGLNVILRRSLGIDTAVALSAVSKAADHTAVLSRATRELFFVPWRGVTMIGTDYVAAGGPGEGNEAPPPGVVENFVAEIARVAPKANVCVDDVAMVHWGLLPTESAGSLVPRKSPIIAAGHRESGADGLVVVIGEKLTSAPMISTQVLRLVVRELKDRTFRSRTMASAAGPLAASERAASRGKLSPSAVAHLSSRYGPRWVDVAACGASRPDLLAPIHATADALGIEIVHAIRSEMAQGLDDLVLRRLGIGSAGHPGSHALRRCAEIAAAELGWSEDEARSRAAELDEWYAARARG